MLLLSSGRSPVSARAYGPILSNSRPRPRTRSFAYPPLSSSGPAAETVDPFASKEVYQDNFFDRFMIDVRHADTLPPAPPAAPTL
jgi:hypothetical protein